MERGGAKSSCILDVTRIIQTTSIPPLLLRLPRLIWAGAIIARCIANLLEQVMNIDSTNKWLTLVANFGVVAGIIFLGIEVRQNQVILQDTYRLNRVEARMADVDTFNDLRGQ